MCLTRTHSLGPTACSAPASATTLMEAHLGGHAAHAAAVDPAAAPHIPAAEEEGANQPRPTGLLDLPDQLLGLVSAQLGSDPRACWALYSSCRSCRESPTINAGVMQGPLKARIVVGEAGRPQLPKLAHWPRFAALRCLILEAGDGEGGLHYLPQALQSLPARVQQKLQTVHELRVR